MKRVMILLLVVTLLYPFPVLKLGMETKGPLLPFITRIPLTAKQPLMVTDALASTLPPLCCWG